MPEHEFAAHMVHIFIECAINEIRDSNKGGVKINGENIQFIRFADDIAAFAENHLELQTLITTMDIVFSKYQLKINSNKTKILTASKHPKNNRPVKLNNNILEQVHSFKYLGSIINSEARCTQDIIARIAIAKQAFNRKKQIIKNKKISLNIRKRFIKSYIWSIALYGGETWTMTQRDRQRLEAFEMWCWRRMEGISWTEMVSNERVLERVKEKRSIMDTIENRRGSMIGHLIRHDLFIKNIIEGKIEGKRGRGRPRRTFMEQIKEKVHVGSYQEVKELAGTRKDWRLLHRQEHGS